MAAAVAAAAFAAAAVVHVGGLQDHDIQQQTGNSTVGDLHQLCTCCITINSRRP
jgi:hypothetical protein